MSRHQAISYLNYRDSGHEEGRRPAAFLLVRHDEVLPVSLVRKRLIGHRLLQQVPDGVDRDLPLQLEVVGSADLEKARQLLC